MVSDDYCVIVRRPRWHDRSHGSDLPEDMTIPAGFSTISRFSGTKFKQGNIIDIAPTITAILDVSPDADWEGKVLDEVVEALK